MRLGDCARVVSGATPDTSNPAFHGGQIPWVTPKDISKLDVPELWDTPRKITESGYKNCSTEMLPAGSILFSSRAPIGLVAIAQREMCTNQGFKSIVPGANLDSRYLYWQLKNLAPSIAARGNGSTFKEVSKPTMEDTVISVPPLEEQKRIAAILDKADEIRRKREQAIQLADEFLRSLFLDMFGDPVRNPKGWPEVTISEVSSSMHTGPFGSQLLHSEFVQSGIAVLGIDNAVENAFTWAKPRYITEDKYQQMKRYTVKPGDVLVTIMGTCGRVAIVPENVGRAINTKHLCCLRPDQQKIFPSYLHAAFLYGTQVRRQLGFASRGAIMDGLNMQTIKAIRLPLPPLELQSRYERAQSNGKALALKQDEADDISSFAGLESLSRHAFADTRSNVPRR